MRKNLIHKIADKALLQSCFDDLKLKRKESHHNNDIWHLSHNRDTELPKIISELLLGNYRIESSQNYYIKESNCNVTVGSARDTVVFNAIKVVLENRMKKVSNFDCVSHLKGNS